MAKTLTCFDSFSSLENSVKNIIELFIKLSDFSKFRTEVKEKLNKIDNDLKTSANQLALDPSTSSTHFAKIISLIDLLTKLLREETRIRESLIDI